MPVLRPGFIKFSFANRRYLLFHGRVIPRPSFPNSFLKISPSRVGLSSLFKIAAFLRVCLPVGSDQGFSLFPWLVKLSFRSSGPFQKALALGQLEDFGGVLIFGLREFSPWQYERRCEVPLVPGCHRQICTTTLGSRTTFS